MVQDTACNHNLQFHCQVGQATRAQQKSKEPLQEDQFHSDDSWSLQRKSQSLEGSLHVSRRQVAAEAGAANTSRWPAIHTERFLHPTYGSKCAAPFAVLPHSMPPMASIGPKDCEAGLKTAHDTWSKAKTHWCCLGPRPKPRQQT